MNYYSTLGVSQTASQDEIKTAYRKLAMKHHPDRGGDPKKFQAIQEAYDTLSDDEKRRQYDNPNPFNNMGGGGNPFNNMNPDDIFGSFFGSGPFSFHFGNSPQPQRNTNITAVVDITLADVLTGKNIDAQVSFRNGDTKLVSINIPAGVDDGSQIRYPGMGDHSIPRFPPGDLIVSVRIIPHPVWRREGLDLVCDHSVDVWEALLGSSLTVTTLDNKSFTISVPAGTQPDTVLSCRGEGLPHPRSGHRGNLLVRIKVSIPRTLREDQKLLVEKLKNGI